MEKIAFLFPGQGAQTVGMGRNLYDDLPAARRLFDRAAEILGYNLADVCFNGPESRLNSTEVSQPAIFVTSLAALELLKQDHPEVVERCEAAAGLSLGEYTALVFAGALSFDDGLRVVQRRGQAMQAAADAASSGMVSILGLERDQVRQLCQRASAAGRLEIANLLCPGNIVVSGHRAACEQAVQLAQEMGAMKAVPLAVAGAFHTEIMRPAEGPLAHALAEVPLNSPRIPVISNVDAQPHREPDDIRRTLVRQVLSPVLWEESVRRLLADGFNHFYEIGPGRVLKGLLKRIDRKTPCDTVP